MLGLVSLSSTILILDNCHSPFWLSVVLEDRPRPWSLYLVSPWVRFGYFVSSWSSPCIVIALESLPLPYPCTWVLEPNLLHFCNSGSLLISQEVICYFGYFPGIIQYHPRLPLIVEKSGQTPVRSISAKGDPKPPSPKPKKLKEEKRRVTHNEVRVYYNLIF